MNKKKKQAHPISSFSQHLRKERLDGGGGDRIGGRKRGAPTFSEYWQGRQGPTGEHLKEAFPLASWKLSSNRAPLAPSAVAPPSPPPRPVPPSTASPRANGIEQQNDAKATSPSAAHRLTRTAAALRDAIPPLLPSPDSPARSNSVSCV